jgi:hypothetical protein
LILVVGEVGKDVDERAAGNVGLEAHLAVDAGHYFESGTVAVIVDVRGLSSAKRGNLASRRRSGHKNSIRSRTMMMLMLHFLASICAQWEWTAIWERYQLIVEIEALTVVEPVVVGGHRLRNVEVRNANGALHEILLGSETRARHEERTWVETNG